MPDIDTTVEVEIYCCCGARLCDLAHVEYTRNREPRIIVDPCPACLKRAYDQAYDVGYEKGRDEALRARS